jgi:hypothetical protein
MKRYFIFLSYFLASFLTTNQAFAENWKVDFGPFAGTGSISDAEKIRHATGISFAISRTWALNNKTSIGPMVELINSFVSGRTHSERGTSISSFDHRVASAGFIVDHSFAQGKPTIFLTALLGKGITKLDIDESTSNSFLQYQNSGVPLNYREVALGTAIPIGNSGSTVNLAVLDSNYTVDQSHAVATVNREERNAKGIELTSGVETAERQNLKPKSNQRILGLKIGLTMGF